MKKLLDKIFFGVTLVLIIMSLIALVLVHIELFTNYQFEISTDGISNYLLAFGTFKELFLGTVAVIGGYVAINSYLEGVKINKYSDWVERTEIRYNQISKYDPQIRILLCHNRNDMFDYLEKRDFVFKNKFSLQDFFNKYFKEIVPIIEERNIRYINNGGIYPNKQETYSYLNFQYIFAELVNISKSYPEILKDLHDLYIESLKKDRYIDKDAYNSAVNNALKNKSNNIV